MEEEEVGVEVVEEKMERKVNTNTHNSCTNLTLFSLSSLPAPPTLSPPLGSHERAA